MSSSASLSHHHQPISASDAREALRRLIVQVWLAAVAGLVIIMIAVGGATRLTDSGLSITEWQPLLGALPPLSAADWQIAFEKYRQTLQYRSVNAGMSLEDFKFIFWWEWGHRILGRLIGLAIALPLAIFWLTRWIDSRLALKVFGVGLLVGLQGAIGWYMVQSGLVDRIDVSQYRLALHLTMAFVILGLLVWLALDLSPPSERARLTTLREGHRWSAAGLAAMVLLQVVIGGFVAGLKAGRAYNTWPTMDGQMIPDGLLRMSPWWVNFAENMTLVQFNHRMTAYLLVAWSVWHAVRVIQIAGDRRVVRGAVLLATGLVAQMGIGIWTVLAAVPIGLGIAHQTFAAIMLAVAVGHLHAICRSHQTTAR